MQVEVPAEEPETASEDAITVTADDAVSGTSVFINGLKLSGTDKIRINVSDTLYGVSGCDSATALAILKSISECDGKVRIVID